MAKYLPVLLLLVVVGCMCCKQTCYDRATSPDQVVADEIGATTFIEITMEGGGFYGGFNPVTENTKVIKTTGEILVHTRQLYTGERDETFFVSRGEIEKLGRLIRDSGFFSMKDVYDCEASNSECYDRKKKYPPAVPLHLGVTIGQMRKGVTVTVFESGMIDYPEGFQTIVDRINELIAGAGEQD
jgi:hypothetical protein